jgi:hypothetical protein
VDDALQPKVFAKLFAIDFQSSGGAKNRGRSDVGFSCVKPAEHFDAVASGHLVVRDDKIDSLLNQPRESRFAVVCGFGSESLFGDREFEHAPKHGVIFDDQHGRLHGHEREIRSEVWGASARGRGLLHSADPKTISR